MKNKQPENPLKLMEEQLDRILFDEISKPNYTNIHLLNGANNSIKEMKNHLIHLIKELKSKNLHLVA